MVNNKFMDFIPLLKKQYNREQSKIEPEEIVTIRNEINDLQEELDNDLAWLLAEDKIPQPLLKAYHEVGLRTGATTWYQSGYYDSGELPQRGDNTERLLKYGNNDEFTALDVHSHLKGLERTSYRYNSKWDFGKAYYKKMTKVETINRLGLKIYDMRIRDGQEISAEDAINKPLPPKRYLKVTDPQGMCKQNINKFRFLFRYGSSYRLTEYEYRESTGEYFPIIRETIPDENFEKYKVDAKEFSTYLRADRAPGHQNKTEPKGLIYIIRLADIIYETDEYDHPINYSKHISSLSSVNLGKLSTSLDFMISMINNSEDYIDSHPSTKFNLTDLYNEIYQYQYNNVDWIDLPKELANPEITKIKDMKELIEHFLPENYTATNIRILGDSLSSAIRMLVESPRTTKRRIVDSCDVTAQEAEEIYNQVITSSLSIYGSDNVSSYNLASLSGKNYQMYDKQLDDISDKALKNTYPDERSYELAKRFMKANAPKVGIEKDDNFDTAIQQDIYHPYKVLQDNSRSILKLDNLDTGDHVFRIGNLENNNRYNVSWTDLVFNSDYDSSMREILRQSKTIMDQLAYIKNTRKKVDLKAAMLSAQERYLKVKNNPNRYEDEDDYRAALDRAKAQYIDAKNKYEDNDGDKTFKQKVKDLQQKLIKLFSKETDLNSKKLLSHCYYLQKLNQKIYSLKNKLAQLENLDKEDILDTFGNLNGQLKELQKTCDELTEQITELQSNKRVYENEREQLLRRLAELDNIIASTDSMIEQNNKSLEEVQQKIANSSNNLSSAIYNCYKKQEDLLNQLDTIQTEIKKVNADLEGRDYKEKESKIEFNDKLKDILTFTNDIEEFSDKSPDDAYNVIANND